MWAGALGIFSHFPSFAREAPGYFTWQDEVIEAWLRSSTSHTPLELLVAGRWWVVLGISLLIAACFLPLRRLLGEPLAALALLMIAWMPWSVALSRQLHPDGFVGALIFGALVFFLAWLHAGRRRRDLLASGVLMGLAWLTKTPSAFLVPIGALLVGLEMWRMRREAQSGGQSGGGRALVVGYVLWGAAAAATFFLLWPATWVDPLGTFVKMTAEMEEYVGGHVNPNFFLGQNTADPGPFFYPLAWFLRITPATLVGLLAAGWASWGAPSRRRFPFGDPLVRRTALGFMVAGLLFVLLMTIPAKKFDRYILPVFPMFEVVAALGWAALALALGGWWAARRGDHRGGTRYAPALAVLLLGLVGLHSVFTALHYPYYLTYFNPLGGGSVLAPRILFAGWGEGLDRAGAWLNEQPDAEDLRVVGWYHDGPLSYFTKMQPFGIGSGSGLAWLDTDFVVLYINQVQRNIPSAEAVDWLMAQDPAYKVEFGGLELARIVDLRGKPLPPFVELNSGGAADFGGKIRLLASELDRGVVEPGGEVFAQLYLRGEAPMETNYNASVRLVDAEGRSVWSADGWPWGAPTDQWAPGDIRPDGYHLQVPPDARPGLYKLTLSLYDPSTLEPLPLLDSLSGAPVDPGRRDPAVNDVALLQVGEAPSAASRFAVPWLFGESLALDAVTLPSAAQAGDVLPLALEWRSARAVAEDFTVFVHLVGPDGTLVAQGDRQPLGGFAPTRLWTPGIQVLDDGYAIALPPGLAPGAYEVRVGLYNDQGRLPVTQGGAAAGDYAIAGTFEVK
jgi:hypothetical protein